MLRSIQLAGAANTLPSVTLLSLARNPQRWWEDLLIIVARTKMRLVYPTVPRVLNTNLRVLGIATISQKIPFRLWSCEQSWQLSEGFFICHCIACLFRWIVRKGICVTWEYVLTAYHLFNSSPVALCRPRLWWKARAWGRCPGHDPKWRQEKASIYARLCRFVPSTCIVVGATGLQGAENWMQRSAHPLHSSTAEDVIVRTSMQSSSRHMQRQLWTLLLRQGTEEIMATLSQVATMDTKVWHVNFNLSFVWVTYGTAFTHSLLSLLIVINFKLWLQ